MCPDHGNLIPIGDSDIVSAADHLNRSIASLPEGLEIRESNICDAGMGVFATEHFQVGSVFGPYTGMKMKPNIPKNMIDTTYMWEVRYIIIELIALQTQNCNENENNCNEYS